MNNEQRTIAIEALDDFIVVCGDVISLNTGDPVLYEQYRKNCFFAKFGLKHRSKLYSGERQVLRIALEYRIETDRENLQDETDESIIASLNNRIDICKQLLKIV